MGFSKPSGSPLYQHHPRFSWTRPSGPLAARLGIRHVSEAEVVFIVRADDKGGKRLHRLDGVEFVRRFLLHVLCAGIKRIRHYGLLASGCKAVKLAQARQALQMPAPNALALQFCAGLHGERGWN